MWEKVLFLFEACRKASNIDANNQDLHGGISTVNVLNFGHFIPYFFGLNFTFYAAVS